MRLVILSVLTTAAAVSLPAEPSFAQNVRDSLLPSQANDGKSAVLPREQQPKAIAGSLTIQQIPKSDPQATSGGVSRKTTSISVITTSTAPRVWS